MNEELKLDLLEVFVKHNVIPVTILRNEKIKYEYHELRERGAKGKTARLALAEKYFVSEKNIENILYTKKNNVQLPAYNE